MNKGHIFFISGFAGAGKGTVINGLLDSGITNLELALSSKTREPRNGEIVGVDYNKLSVEEFKLSIDAGDFLEYNFIHNQAYYGTMYKAVIDNGINKGKIIIKEMDILTLPKLIESKPELRENFTYIFLDIPIEKIKVRMKDRGDDTTGDDFDNRILSAQKEKELLHFADYVIDGTQSKEKVLDDVKKIILNKE